MRSTSAANPERYAIADSTTTAVRFETAAATASGVTSPGSSQRRVAPASAAMPSST